MKPDRFIFCCACVLSLTLPAVAEAPKATSFERMVGRVVSNVMTFRHYQQYTLNDERSKSIFDRCLDDMDPDRMYFHAGDIKEFAVYRREIDNLMPRGRLDFGYTIHERYVQRVEERMAYARKRLLKPFDYTLAETMSLDRSKAPWAKDAAALDELWRLGMKNDCLAMLLSTGGHSGAAQPGTRPMTPEERNTATRVLRAYEASAHEIASRTRTEIMEVFLNSLTAVYDQHSTSMAPVTRQNFDINMQMTLQGIGAYLYTDGDYITVRDVLPGGPAERDGRLTAGDRILEVKEAGKPPLSLVKLPMNQAIAHIRGPKGSVVTLTISAGDDDEPVQIELERDIIRLGHNKARHQIRKMKKTATATELFAPTDQDVTVSDTDGVTIDGETEADESVTDSGDDPTADTVEADPDEIKKPGDTETTDTAPPEIPEDKPDPRQNILVIDLPNFYTDFRARAEGDDDYGSSTRDVLKLIEQRGGPDKVSGIILDLRGNPGGSLLEAVELTGLFIPSGPVVQVRSALLAPRVLEDTDKGTAYDGPLIVLVDHNSASAAEILAGALQDYGRAVIVGEKSTHGKGTVQAVVSISDMLPAVKSMQEQNPGSIKFTSGKFYRVTGATTQNKGVTPDITYPSFRDHQEVGEAHLPFAMPWDSMRPVAVKSAIDIRPLLPELRKLKDGRLAEDEAYKERAEDIAAFAKRSERKTLPLKWDERKELREADREWSRKIRRSSGYHRGPNDFLLDEAMAVMGDLIELWEK
jgi:carboxyl-terminal processing protease